MQCESHYSSDPLAILPSFLLPTYVKHCHCAIGIFYDISNSHYFILKGLHHDNKQKISFHKIHDNLFYHPSFCQN